MTSDDAVKAIRAYCYQCSGESAKAVKRCQATKCPLYDYRCNSAVERKLKKERGGQIHYTDVMKGTDA